MRHWKLDETESGKREIFHSFRAVSRHVGNKEGELQEITLIFDERCAPLVVGPATYATHAVAVIVTSLEKDSPRSLIP